MTRHIGRVTNRAAFAAHAAPEAVAAHLEAAKKRAARENAEVRWLTELLASKTATQNENEETR